MSTRRLLHSVKCNYTTYWDSPTRTCVSCPIEPGYQVTPNCGKDDDGSIHEVGNTLCKENTFNDGSSAFCRRCASCRPGFRSSPCTSTTDIQCEDPGSGTNRVPVTVPTSKHVSTFLSIRPTTQINEGGTFPPSPGAPMWAVPLVILISITLVVICACLIFRKRKRGKQTVMSYSRRSSFINAGFAPLSAPTGNNDQKGLLSPNIRSAPLQTVLDNLDVLEELVILLDPESHGVKTTKHLASHCSFPATWITYTYSMKESKSPLKAVLEGVTCRHPDWTVGHLAKLLGHMKRYDAIAVLAKLELNVIEM
ncbi:IGF-like family receptor 1 isoform X1 [Notothenia coriiceps]|uniref:IGF-like family receptor 1 isoform X1 n=1 Tax=Notothenia coriiceps TaxID=8208 RepID=A0A6I9PB54_9TELE|nr:PREDICTED: IGF-like family receptor 1 isoform X1 [Notothenia coriiceps]